MSAAVPATVPTTWDGPVRRTWSLIGLLARTERWALTALPVVAGVVTAVLTPSYARTYPTPEQLARAVAECRSSEVFVFLYGTLPAGAGVTRLAVWETGALTCLVLGVVVALRAVALTRGAEETGLAETQRAAGSGPAEAVAAAGTVLGLECLLLGLGAGWGLTALTGTGPADATAYAGSVAVTCAVVAAASLVVAQVVGDAVVARRVCVAVLVLCAATAGGRAAYGWDLVGWASPFRLRSAVDPGGANRWEPLAVGAVGAVLLVALACGLAGRRDLGAGIVRVPARPRGPLRVRGPLGLCLHLELGGALAWACVTAVSGGVFTAMGEDVVSRVRAGGVGGGTLGSLLSTGDPGEGFLRYVGALAATLAALQAVGVAGRPALDERAGLLELLRTTGWGPGRLLLAAWTAAVAGGALTLALTGLVMGAVGRTALGTGWGDAVRLVGGQLPAVAAAAGLASLLAGAWPRGRALAWVAVLVAVGLVQLGPVLDLPSGVLDAAPLAQAGSVGSLVLAAVGLAGAAAGTVAVGHRDLRP